MKAAMALKLSTGALYQTGELGRCCYEKQRMKGSGDVAKPWGNGIIVHTGEVQAGRGYF